MKHLRTILALVLVLALLMGFAPVSDASLTAAAFTPPHDVIRIGLNAPNCWAVTSSVTLTNSGGLRIGTFNAARVLVPNNNTSHNSLTVTATGTSVIIRNAAGTTLHSGAGPIAVAPVNSTTTTTYTLPFAPVAGNTNRTFQFFGGFRFTASGGNLTVVNYVDMEGYIKGVVPYEMPASWPLEALKAQAVAARTFAVRHFGRRNSQGFDLRNTTADQVYRGVGGSANANSNRSVTDTRGMIMLHNGRPIGAYYHAASGGATENSSNVWSAQYPFLVGVRDPYETITSIRWTRTLTPTEFRNHMRRNNNAAGFNLPDIVDVIPEYTAMGNMLRVTFVASNGARQTYSRGDTRTRVNSGLHPTFNSQRFTITRNGPRAASAAAPEPEILDALNDTYQNNLYTLEELYAYHSEAEITEMAEAGQVRLHTASEEAIEALNTGGVTFTVQNYGFGHNVGMSQWGANGMARAGYTFDRILRHYYTGVTITGVVSQPTGFIDVSPNAWYYRGVQYAHEQGLINGVGGNRFAPHATATRAEFATVLGRMAQINPRDWARPGTVTTQGGGAVNVRSGPGAGNQSLGTRPTGAAVQIIGQDIGTDNMVWFRIIHGTGHGYMRSDFVRPQDGPFSDVAAGTWYAPFVEWGHANNIISGIGGGRFNPGGLITRQEMAVLLHNYAIRHNIPLRQDAVPPFLDMAYVDAWAIDSVTAMQRAGVIRGDEHRNFNPLANSIRAEKAMMVSEFHQLYLR